MPHACPCSILGSGRAWRTARPALSGGARRPTPALVRASEPKTASATHAGPGETDPAASLTPPPSGEVPKVLSSYDDGGYEAGAMPHLMTGEVSDDEAVVAEQSRDRQAASCLLLQDDQQKAEYEAALALVESESQAVQDQLMSREQVLESIDGMVGNWVETQLDEKQKELQEAADDYTRLLAELKQLEAAASARGRSAASSADIGEGVGVQDIE